MLQKPSRRLALVWRAVGVFGLGQRHSREGTSAIDDTTRVLRQATRRTHRHDVALSLDLTTHDNLWLMRSRQTSPCPWPWLMFTTHAPVHMDMGMGITSPSPLTTAHKSTRQLEDRARSPTWPAKVVHSHSTTLTTCCRSPRQCSSADRAVPRSQRRAWRPPHPYVLGSPRQLRCAQSRTRRP